MTSLAQLSLAQLEEELGVTLLVRGPNSVKLTEAGERFYEEARDVLARADDAVCRVRGEAGKEILRVGYTSSMASRIVASVLAKFQAAALGCGSSWRIFPRGRSRK